MTSSLSGPASGRGLGSAPDCADYWLCQQVYDWFGLDWLPGDAPGPIAPPAEKLLIVVLATLVRYLAHRGIRRLTERTATGSVPSILRGRRGRTAARGDALEQL